MKWYNPQTKPFLISGFPFYETDRTYRRMPLHPTHPLPEAVDGLANETAGGQIRFHGKLKTLAIQVSLASKPLYFSSIPTAHLTLTNKRCFDLYVSRDGGDYFFAGMKTRLAENDTYYEHTLIDLPEAEELDILLNFPLYGGVDKILIGVDDKAEISEAHKKFVDDKKIVIYGSSIQQGGCASRPGMVDANILSRWLNREVYDLGFNSSGKAEPEMAHIISQIDNVAALIISVEGNCPDQQWLDEKVREFLKIYRQKHPTTPIILMPFVVGGLDLLVPANMADRLDRRGIQKKIVEDLRAAGDENIHLLVRESLLEKEFEGHPILHESTVDGLHYTDLGYFWSAQVMYQFLKKLL